MATVVCLKVSNLHKKDFSDLEEGGMVKEESR